MMRNTQKILALLILGAILFAPMVVQACPLCRDAIAVSDNEEPSNLPAAMNQSIYMMIAVPYLLLGFTGYFIWRGVQKNAAYLEAMKARGDSDPPA